MNVTNITNASRNAIVLPWNKGDYARNNRLQVKAAFKENLLDHMASLDPNTEINPHPLTKIICCLGPLKSSVQDIELLMEAGVTSMIIPMWLFTPEEKLLTIRNIREAVNNYSTKIDRVFPLGVGIDLRGPQVHTGRLFENEAVDVLEGTTFTLTTMPVWGENGTATKVFIDSPDLPSQIISGTDLILDSGNIVLNVSHIVDEEEIICKVMKGGKLHNNRVVHQMETPAPLKEITPSDVEDIEFAIEMGLDFISISSVRFECVVKEIRRLLDFRKSSIMLVSKIENKVAVNNLEAIVKESDAINLVRNSLAVEISEERIFLIQDNVTAICKLLGKPIYIEGNILQRPMNSTIESEQIDVMDVVSSLQKGIDGFVMRDTFPLQCNPKKVISNLINLCKLAEPSYWHSHFFNKLSTMASPPIDPTHAISIAVVEAAMKAGATAILVCTASGTSAKLVCRYLPRVPVIAITRYGRVARQLALFKAAVPFHYVAPAVKDWQKDVDLRFQAGIVLGKEKGFIKPGDALVLLSGWRPGAGFTNTMRMTYASQTDPWVHLKDFGLSKGRAEEAVCQTGDECPYQLY